MLKIITGKTALKYERVGGWVTGNIQPIVYNYFLNFTYIVSVVHIFLLPHISYNILCHDIQCFINIRSTVHTIVTCFTLGEFTTSLGCKVSVYS